MRLAFLGPSCRQVVRDERELGHNPKSKKGILRRFAPLVRQKKTQNF